MKVTRRGPCRCDGGQEILLYYYLMMPSIHFINCNIGVSRIPTSLLVTEPTFNYPRNHNKKEGRKEGNILFNNALNTFYLRLYGVRDRVKDHSDSERGNPLPPHGLLFPISIKGSFICIIP